MTDSGPVLSAMEAELRERAMKLASVIDAAVQAPGAAAMPLSRGIQALSALGFGSRCGRARHIVMFVLMARVQGARCIHFDQISVDRGHHPAHQAARQHCHLHH